jgi:hypothetical protein
VLDELFASDVDWRELVGRYPRLALAVAACGGLVLGFRHGPTLVTALSDALGDRAASAIRSAAADFGAAEESEADEAGFAGEGFAGEAAADEDWADDGFADEELGAEGGWSDEDSPER